MTDQHLVDNTIWTLTNEAKRLTDEEVMDEIKLAVQRLRDIIENYAMIKGA